MLFLQMHYLEKYLGRELFSLCLEGQVGMNQEGKETCYLEDLGNDVLSFFF